jgi:tetratricopeptide (TPR) repeat protein
MRLLDDSCQAFTEALEILRTLAQAQPNTYLPDVATTLNNISSVFATLRRLDESHLSIIEALDIRRMLAQNQPTVYLPDVAVTLNHLGNILLDLRLHNDSRRALVEALEILRKLAQGQPNVYLPDVAATLNNLSNVLSALHLLDDSRIAAAEALEIRRTLAQGQPNVHLPDVAITLNNLGGIFSALHLLDDSRLAYNEALDIRRTLAAVQPNVYLPDVATTLNNLGAVLSTLRLLDDSRNAYNEALDIRRMLAAVQPSVYLPDVAATLNNLGTVLIALRLLDSSLIAITEALDIRRMLALSQPNVFLPDVATTLNNLGIVLDKLHLLDKSRQAFSEALDIYRALALTQPDAYLPDLADTLNNLGNVLRALRFLDDSRKAFSSSVEHYRSLAFHQPNGFRPYLAMALNNLGNVLHDLNLFADSRQALTEALDIRRSLALGQPNAFCPDVAMTLNNLGNVYHRLGLLDESFRAFTEAATTYVNYGDSIAAALPWANLARLEMKVGSRDAALQHSRTSIQAMETGLVALGENAHHDKFKRIIDDAYGRLILDYAQSDDSLYWAQLPALLETLRRVEVLSITGTGPIHSGPDEKRSFVLQGTQPGDGGRWSDKLASLSAAFLWIQRETEGDEQSTAAFVLLRPGKPLQAWAGSVGPLWKLMGKIHKEPTQRQLGMNAWDSLPGWLQETFLDPEIRTVFVSPCANSAAVPLEYLFANGDWIGLQKLIVRTHGLLELDEVLPRSVEGKNSIVVGNPPHEGTDNLPEAQSAACDVHRMAGAASTCRIGPLATRDDTLKLLRDPNLRMFLYIGHGQRGRLELAAKGILHWKDLPKGCWPGHPFVHLDCCNSGLAWSQGGGRMAGMPFAALEAGASTVLSSSVPLYDKPAADFTRALYRGLLEQGLNVGDALMAARREIHLQYPNAPHHWGSSVLWGNPAIRLKDGVLG